MKWVVEVIYWYEFLEKDRYMVGKIINLMLKLVLEFGLIILFFIGYLCLWD